MMSAVAKRLTASLEARCGDRCFISSSDGRASRQLLQFLRRQWTGMEVLATDFNFLFLEEVSLGRPPISESDLGYVKRKKLKSHKNDIFVHLTVICAKLYSVAHNASPRSKPHSGHTPRTQPDLQTSKTDRRRAEPPGNKLSQPQQPAQC